MYSRFVRYLLLLFIQVTVLSPLLVHAQSPQLVFDARLNLEQSEPTPQAQSILENDVRSAAGAFWKDDEGCQDEFRIIDVTEGSFTRDDRKQTAVLYTYCMTGHGSWRNGIVILEDGSLAAHIAYHGGAVSAIGAWPDLNENGISEIIIAGVFTNMGGTESWINIIEIKNEQVVGHGSLTTYQSACGAGPYSKPPKAKRIYFIGDSDLAFSAETYEKPCEGQESWTLTRQRASIELNRSKLEYHFLPVGSKGEPGSRPRRLASNSDSLRASTSAEESLSSLAESETKESNSTGIPKTSDEGSGLSSWLQSQLEDAVEGLTKLLFYVWIIMGGVLPLALLLIELKLRKASSPSPWRLLLPVGLTTWGVYTAHAVGAHKMHMFVSDVSVLTGGGRLSGFGEPWIVATFGLEGAGYVLILLGISCILISGLMLRQHYIEFHRASKTETTDTENTPSTTKPTAVVVPPKLHAGKRTPPPCRFCYHPIRESGTSDGYYCCKKCRDLWIEYQESEPRKYTPYELLWDFADPKEVAVDLNIEGAEHLSLTDLIAAIQLAYGLPPGEWKRQSRKPSRGKENKPTIKPKKAQSGGNDTASPLIPPTHSEQATQGQLDMINHKDIDRMPAYCVPLSDFILTDTSPRVLLSVIREVNAHLVRIKSLARRGRCAREVSITLTGEAIVAFQMCGELLTRPESTSARTHTEAQSEVESLRRKLYSDNVDVFEPYFNNEPGIVDLDLSLFRLASNRADQGDSKAQSQIDYMFCYYHAVLGMYYGYQTLILSGISHSEAVHRVSGVEGSSVIPGVLQSLTAHFGAVLVNPNPNQVGKFEPLYRMP